MPFSRLSFASMWIGGGVLLFICMPPADAAGHAVDHAMRIHFHPIGTPEFPGAPKIGQPGFVGPVAEVIYMPMTAKCLSTNRTGEYEAIIDSNGSVSGLHSYHSPVSGDACERTHLFPYLMKWQFKPATHEGKPTPVFMWFGVGP
jgi:hypothetical protein